MHKLTQNNWYFFYFTPGVELGNFELIKKM